MASVAAVQHKERVAKALNAMEGFGLKKKEITPILHNLLKLYNNEWEFIEAENYRVLADSYFEAQESQQAQKTSRGGGGGGPVTRARRAHSGSDDDSDYSPSPPRWSPPPPENPATSRNGRSDALVPVKRSNSPPASGRGGDALPANVARAVDYHSGASVRTRAATASLQVGASPGTRGRVFPHNSASAAAAAAAAREKEKGKSPLVSESRRPLPSPSSRVVKGTPNHVTVKLEVSDSLPAPEGFEKVAFEKVDGVIKVRTPNGAVASPKPALQLTTPVKIADEATIQRSEPRTEVFSPAPLLAKDPTTNERVVCVKAEPQEASAGPPVREDVSFDQSVQCELSLEAAQPSAAHHLQIVPYGTIFAEGPPSVEQPLNVIAGPSPDQAPNADVEERDDRTVLPLDNEDRDGLVLSLVDYDDDPEPEKGTGSDVVEPPQLNGGEIRPNFIVTGFKRDIVDAQVATDPKRQKCEASTQVESDEDKSAPSTAPPRRRLILHQSPPDHRVNGDSECILLERPSAGPSTTAGVKRKLIITGPEGTSSTSKEIGVATVRNGDTAKVVADRCEERGKGAPEGRGQGIRNSAMKRVKAEPGVEDPNAQQLKHDSNDISRGTERIPIPFVNDFTSETIPHKFNYIPSNVVYQNAYINISMDRIGDEDCCADCVGDCLKAPHSCPCTRETGGEFAYTQDGLLKPELIRYELDRSDEKVFCSIGWGCPIERAKEECKTDKCKGHLVRRFIKECWHKCGCSMRCGNRVVQRGINRRLQVFFTNDGKGWGLRTAEDLPAGSFVCEYVGEIMTNMELDQRNQEVKRMDACGQLGTHKDTYPVLLDGDWCSESGLKDEEALCLDATRYGNVARFINHRCFDANLIDVPVSIEGLDRHYYHVAFFTSRDVQAEEELTWDYKIDFEDEDHPIEAFQCLCKSQYCCGARTIGTKKHKK